MKTKLYRYWITIARKLIECYSIALRHELNDCIAQLKEKGAIKEANILIWLL